VNEWNLTTVNASLDDGNDAAVLAYLSLGSNQGNRMEHLRAAVMALQDEEGVDVSAASPVYETEAHTLDPDEEQPAYLNAVVEVRTTRTPEQLLDVAQRIEAERGRQRERRWAPRTLDVDLLVVGTETRDTDRLTLPHPRLGERRFVLRPLADLAPNLRLPPPFEAPVFEALHACSDATEVRRVDDVLPAS